MSSSSKKKNTYSKRSTRKTIKDGSRFIQKQKTRKQLQSKDKSKRQSIFTTKRLTYKYQSSPKKQTIDLIIIKVPIGCSWITENIAFRKSTGTSNEYKINGEPFSSRDMWFPTFGILEGEQTKKLYDLYFKNLYPDKVKDLAKPHYLEPFITKMEFFLTFRKLAWSPWSRAITMLNEKTKREERILKLFTEKALKQKKTPPLNTISVIDQFILDNNEKIVFFEKYCIQWWQLQACAFLGDGAWNNTMQQIRETILNSKYRNMDNGTPVENYFVFNQTPPFTTEILFNETVDITEVNTIMDKYNCLPKWIYHNDDETSLKTLIRNDIPKIFPIEEYIQNPMK